MKKTTRFVGLDVHAETIAIAVAEPGRGGEVRSLGVIPNRPEAVRKLVHKLGGAKSIQACYEAGPTGYTLYWQLTAMGVECEVVAPTLVPEKAGDRVKTDRRDAIKLARCFRAGELTKVWVPDPAHEALRDLVRAREAAKKDQLRARHRMGKFLLRAGRRSSDDVKAWSAAYVEWLRGITFEHMARQATMVDYLGELDHVAERIRRLEQAIDDAVKTAPEVLRAVIDGLQTLRGVAKLTATTLAVEVGNFSRFDHPKRLMGYAGITPSEYSTGKSRRKGAITKTGNGPPTTRARRGRLVVSPPPWQRTSTPCSPARAPSPSQRDRVEGTAPPAPALCRPASEGKPQTKVVTAIGRELLGFVWAIAIRIEHDHANRQPRNERRAA
jgi:transposase